MIVEAVVITSIIVFVVGAGIALRRVAVRYEEQAFPTGSFEMATKNNASGPTSTSPLKELRLEIGDQADDLKEVEHVVTPRDTIEGIMLHYGVKLAALQQTNGFTGKNFQSCKTLKIKTSAVPMAPRGVTAETQQQELYTRFCAEASTKISSADTGAKVTIKVTPMQAKYYINMAKSDMLGKGEKCTDELLEFALEGWWSDLSFAGDQPSNDGMGRIARGISTSGLDRQQQVEVGDLLGGGNSPRDIRRRAESAPLQR
jgi:hypothetical protein